MTARLINLRAWEAAALAEGRATALVRVCKPQPPEGLSFHGVTLSSTCRADEGKAVFAIGQSPLLKDAFRIRCPFGAPVDVILGREAWRRAYPKTSYSEGIVYRADASRSLGMDEYSQRHKWNPSITMPRHAIRARYTNGGVRCMRVQELTEQDAVDLGIIIASVANTRVHKSSPMARQPFAFAGNRDMYSMRFEVDHGPGAWAANPWVFIARLTK